MLDLQRRHLRLGRGAGDVVGARAAGARDARDGGRLGDGEHGVGGDAGGAVSEADKERNSVPSTMSLTSIQSCLRMPLRASFAISGR